MSRRRFLICLNLFLRRAVKVCLLLFNNYIVELFKTQLVERKEELEKLTQEFEDHRNQTEQESHQILLNHQKEISELQVDIKKLEGDKEEANEKLDNLHNK